MKSKLLVSVFFSMVCASAHAVVIDFEGGAKPAGFTYTQFNNLRGSTYFTQDTGYVRGQTTAGGDWVGFTFGDNEQSSISSVSTFDFYGAYVTAAWQDNLALTLRGYNGTTLLYTQNFVLDDDGPTWTDSDFFGITRLTVSSCCGVDAGTPGGGNFVAWDDIHINEDRVQVPAPLSVAVFGLGLIGLGFARRKA